MPNVITPFVQLITPSVVPPIPNDIGKNIHPNMEYHHDHFPTLVITPSLSPDCLDINFPLDMGVLEVKASQELQGRLCFMFLVLSHNWKLWRLTFKILNWAWGHLLIHLLAKLSQGFLALTLPLDYPL